MIKANVESIKKFLESQGMNAVIEEKTPELPFDQIFVPLGVDEGGRSMMLQIQFLEMDVSEIIKEFSLKKTSTSLVNLQFYYCLPFKIKDEYIAEIARMVAELNRSCLVPGFEFSEVDRMVCYRSALLAVEEMDETVFIMTLSAVMSNIEIFSSSIEDVGSGKTTLADLVKDAQKTT